MGVHVWAAGLLLALPASAMAAGHATAGGAPRCGGRTATIVGTVDDDVLTGTSGSDVIVGLRGRDTVDGRGGGDVICGGYGGDVIEGGAGRDRVFGGPGLDRVSGGDGADHLAGGRGRRTVFSPGAGDDVIDGRSLAFPYVDYSTAPRAVMVDLAAGTAAGWGTDTILLRGGRGGGVGGSTHGDTLSGTAYHDRLRGHGGFDRVDARAGDDRVAAVEGDLVGGDGEDDLRLVSASAASSSIAAGPGADLIRSPADGPRLDGGGGDDYLVLDVTEGFGAGTPSFFGAEGVDYLTLKSAALPSRTAVVFDMGTGGLHLGAGSALATGFEGFRLFADRNVTSVDVAGTDASDDISLDSSGTAPVTVQGLGGDDFLTGGAGIDTLDGGPGDDKLWGLRAHDRLLGDAGDDVLNGGGGTDTAEGGFGTDTCYYVENPTSCETVQNP
jgi:Ca2+-binding RTX toxin-like protein